jgi:hypothetical protein
MKLFADVPLRAKGFRSIAFSRWFARLFNAAVATAPRTCFHSFRHCLRDAARNARIDRDIALTIGGWTTGGGQRESAEAYGSGYQPQLLFDAIAAIRFEGVDHTCSVYRADPPHADGHGFWARRAEVQPSTRPSVSIDRAPKSQLTPHNDGSRA